MRVLRTVVALLACVSGALHAGEGVALPAKDKVKVFLLIGQSNMAGRGKLAEGEMESHPRVVALSQEKQWVPGKDPLHFDKKAAGVGLAQSFARAYADAHPDQTVALVPCAVGGTSLAQWQPGEKLYTAAVERAKVALKSGTLAGILWHQGESDQAKAAEYAAGAEKMFAQLRTDLGAPEVPVVVGTLGDFCKNGAALNAVLKSLPEKIKSSACADAAGLAHGGDNLHFGTPALKELGLRYYACWKKLAGAK
jgi:hypothetical protein